MKVSLRVIVISLVLFVVPLVLLAALYGWVAWRSPAPDSSVLVRTADRKLAWAGEPVRVSLHVNLDRAARSQAVNVAPKPAMLMLLIDHSSSMGAGPESTLELAKNAAASFAQSVAAPTQPVGVVMFDDTATTVHDISPDGAAVAEAVLGIPSGGSTDIAAAVVAGHQALRSSRQSNQFGAAAPTMILLSDGQSEPAAALAAAAAAKAEGIHIVTIGLGTQINDSLLKGIASTEADFHFTLDAGSLSDVYYAIVADLGTVVGYDGQLVEQFRYGAFTLEQRPLGLTSRGDIDRGILETRLPLLFQQRRAVSYVLEAQQFGLFGLALDVARLTYVPNRDRPNEKQEIVSSLQPPILVISIPLLLLLYAPFLGYVASRIWDWWLTGRIIPAPEVVPDTRIVPPSPLTLPPVASIRPRQAQPTLFIGIGQAGGRVLEGIARLLASDRYLSGTTSLPFAFRYFDVRNEGLSSPPDQRVAIEKIQMPNRMAGIARPLQDMHPLPEHLRWLPVGELRDATGVDLDLSKGAQGHRWLARLSLFSALSRKDGQFWDQWKSAVTWLEGQDHPSIVLFGSIESGTGGGVLYDVAHLIRQALPPARRAESPIVAVGLADLTAEHGNVGSNQEAFLTELERVTVAAQVPQPRNYCAPGTDAPAFLRGQTDERIFDRFLLMQAQGPGDPYVFEQAAILAHTMTERSFADQINAHLGNLRPQEEIVHTELLRGTIDTAREYVVRWPVVEQTRRLGCRFVMEILGKERLVGVTLSPDGLRLTRAPLPARPLEEAMAVWARLPAPHRLEGTAYQAYCHGALSGDPRQLVAGLENAAAAETQESFHRGMTEFARRWLYLLLNGPGELSDVERATWRRHKLLLSEAALEQLAGIGQAALTVGGSDRLRAILQDAHRFHAALLQQVRGWLHVLVGSDLDGASPQDQPGVYRLANDEYARIAEAIAVENRAPWRTALWGDAVTNPELREDALYRSCFEKFLADEHGFLLRWIWEFDSAAATSDPELTLRVITDREDVLRAQPETARTLYAKLQAVAEGQTRRVDSLSVLDALRSPSADLQLESLARSFVARVESDPGLRVDRQQPAADRIVRHAFVMTPDLPDKALEGFHQTVGRLLICPASTVRHGDAHSIRIVIVDSIVPIGALVLERANRRGLPFVEAPEQESERLQSEVERAGLASPCPPFHPLIRLLTVAPRPRAEWAGIIAEDCVRPGYPDGVRRTIVIADGGVEESLLSDNQRESLVLAVLNLAFRIRGTTTADAVAARWHMRAVPDRLRMLSTAIAAWRDRGEQMRTHDPERALVGQIVLLMELERDGVERASATP